MKQKWLCKTGVDTKLAAMKFSFVSGVVVLTGACALGEVVPPPEARPVVEEFYGVKVTDPYRYFEEPGNEEVAEWSRKTAAHAGEVLAAMPARERTGQLTDAARDAVGDEIHSITRASGDMLYLLMTRRGENIAKLYRKAPHRDAELVLDPGKVVAGGESPPSIGYFGISQDQSRLSVGISSGGKESGELYFFDLENGEQIDGPIDRTRWGPGSWLPDNSGYIYSRMQKLEAGGDPQETFQRSIVYLHRFDGTEDLPVFGIGVNDGIEVKPEDICAVRLIPGTDWLLAENSTGVSADNILCIARLDGVLKGEGKWLRFSTRGDLTGAFRGGSVAIRGNSLFVVTRKDAPNGRIVKMDLDTLDFDAAETVYAPERGVLQQLLDTREGIYVRVLDGGPSRVFRLGNGAMDQPEEIKFPEDGRISIHGRNGTDPRYEGVYFTLSSWTRPPKYFHVNARDRVARPITLCEEAEPDICSALTSYQLMIPSHDGVKIPVSITHRKDLEKGVGHPLLLVGYGAYGITIEPRFYSSDAALYQQGGIKAVAHVRGGGALGDAWRLAGHKATKPNTWRDFIAVAEGVVKEGLTTPGQICIQGGSAGGITVGRSITERADAFGAAVILVGLSDALRMETTPNGVPNIPEFGSVKTKEGFHALHAMSPYHHVKDGVEFPPTLLCHGANDTRVNLWHSQKMAARLMAANMGDAPILLRIDYHAGHGRGSSKKQVNDLYSDVVGFLFEHCRE